VILVGVADAGKPVGPLVVLMKLIGYGKGPDLCSKKSVNESPLPNPLIYLGWYELGDGFGSGAVGVLSIAVTWIWPASATQGTASTNTIKCCLNWTYSIYQFEKHSHAL
jgi:hypothetical protein